MCTVYALLATLLCVQVMRKKSWWRSRLPVCFALFCISDVWKLFVLFASRTQSIKRESHNITSIVALCFGVALCCKCNCRCSSSRSRPWHDLLTSHSTLRVTTTRSSLSRLSSRLLLSFVWRVVLSTQNTLHPSPISLPSVPRHHPLIRA